MAEQTVRGVDDPTLIHSSVLKEGMSRLEEENKAPRSQPKQSVSTAGYAVGGSLAIWQLLMEETSGVPEARLGLVHPKVILQTFSGVKERETCVRR